MTINQSSDVNTNCIVCGAPLTPNPTRHTTVNGEPLIDDDASNYVCENCTIPTVACRLCENQIEYIGDNPDGVVCNTCKAYCNN